MNEDMKLGYNIGCQRLNEEIDTMIDELHNAYMNHTNKEAKDRLDAQIKILWSFKSRIEDVIVESIEISKDKQPKTDWIPCEERLPDDFMSMKYLTTIKGHFYPEINYYCVVNHKWFSSEKTTKELNVIAWQPLPQPYKKEGAENE